MAVRVWAAVLVLLLGVATGEFAFSAGFSSDMVLQKAPAKAAVYGVGAVGVVQVSMWKGEVELYTVEAEVRGDGTWKAYLRPVEGGAEPYVVQASHGGTLLKLERVVFGDVFVCSGQSNMALSMWYTYSARNVTKAVLAGAYENLRFMMYGNMWVKYEAFEPIWATTLGNETWYNVTWAAGQPNPDSHHLNPFNQFSATCMYFAIELTDRMRGMGREVTPIGLVQIAVGGTQIEAWMDNTTLTECRNESLKPGVAPPSQLYYGMVAPFANTTVAGWVWYQGENNCFGEPGNSAAGTGYGCELVSLVKLWRRVWSAEPGTTDPEAPFGVVTLAAGGSEGYGQNMAHMRWSQTGNYGVLPNKAMPRTFLAQAYDLGDPWDNRMASKNNCSHPDPATGRFGPMCKVWSDDGWDPAVKPLAPLMRNGSETPVFMGPIHPRLKRPVGRRLAEAYVNQFLGGKGSIAGPTISGCEVGAKTIELRFHGELLGEDRLVVQPFNTTGWSDSNAMLVCTGAHPLANETVCACSAWDFFWSSGEAFWYCRDGPGWKPTTPPVVERDGVSRVPKANPFLVAWHPAPILTTPSSSWSVTVDLSKVNTTGGVLSVKYAWPFYNMDTCCTSDDYMKGYVPCQPAACPLLSSGSWLPASPFFATVVGGKCKCLPPQTCDT